MDLRNITVNKQSTDANEDVKKVKCDVALIPIGGHYTMDKKQAADFKDYIDIVDKEIQIELKL